MDKTQQDHISKIINFMVFFSDRHLCSWKSPYPISKLKFLVFFSYRPPISVMISVSYFHHALASKFAVRESSGIFLLTDSSVFLLSSSCSSPALLLSPAFDFHTSLTFLMLDTYFQSNTETQ